MSKIIIHIDDDVPEFNAADCVAVVVRQGKISANGTSYCHASRFKTGIMVTTDGTRKDGNTTFHVYRSRLQLTPPTREAGDAR